MDGGDSIRDPGMDGRKRLIDHFKRVYNIVAGLAITEAVRHLFPIYDDFFHGPAPWLFVTFIVTIVPIFHGGDRSLDAKYWDRPRTVGLERFWFLVDVWALLITAMAFVAIAEAIPRPDGCDAAGRCSAPLTFSSAKWFTLLLGITVAFDVLVLVAEFARGSRGTPGDTPAAAAARKGFLGAYPTWIRINTPFAVACAFAACMTWNQWGIADALPIAVQSWTLPLLTAAALLRTYLDYLWSGDSLFP